ncbi:DEAD/DEAH box helicase [Glaciibacter sp. 2TAF33]|uniref:DEAD/DEAH box helicase n=1 Tax=Glaciibacter sp. 2TAF33 TaxID=3233015 RepID=UPI003F8E8C26
MKSNESSTGEAHSYSLELKGAKWTARQFQPANRALLASNTPTDPADVVKSWPEQFVIREEYEGKAGLRRPQAGAIHSLLGYWTTDPKLPATVVMPTGTGKTDTMVTALVAQRIDRLLVLVPSDALRDQLALKFEELGVLQHLQLVPETSLFPVVGKLNGALEHNQDAEHLAGSCNVVVATPQALSHTEPEIRTHFLSLFSHLFIDEAHHVAAKTWQQLRDEFAPKPVVQFTATPHRRDGQHLGGTLVYVFPLREAQREGYFSKIRYKSVLSLLHPDEEVAEAAIGYLRSDIEAGRDHLLMARVRSVSRAEEVHALYAKIAPDLSPVLVHSGINKSEQAIRIARLRERTSRILVCVDMFGEGFDLPQLKVAALHDPHRSLGITLQFVGRFARGGVHSLGSATVVSARTEVRQDEALRRLYAEDADWDQIIEDLSAAAVDEQVEIDEFMKAFSSLPDEVSIHSLTPAMSTVVFKPKAIAWHPESLTSVIGRSDLVTYPIPTNTRDGVAWFVTRTKDSPRWGSVADAVTVAYDLYVIYWDATRGLLYINSSNNDSLHEELARAVSGDTDALPLSGEVIYRVFDGVQRLTPTNVGLLDARNRSRRYTSYVGSDVTEALPLSQSQTKTQTHIAGTGFLDGGRYSVAGSLKGRVWSHRTADGLKQWTDWCDVVGPKIVDPTISVDKIMAGFIRPEELNGWPAIHALALELPSALADQLEDSELKVGSSSIPFHELSIELRGQPNSTRLPFAIVCDEWRVDYDLVLTKAGLRVEPQDSSRDAMIQRTRSLIPFSQLASRHGLRVLLAADSIVEPPGLLLRPNRALEPFSRDRLTVIDWTGINIRRESWGANRDPRTVQGRMVEHLLGEDWDILIDDDGSGEVADVVALREADGVLLVRLVHCKYSSNDRPGARVTDLYELAGQAQRSAALRRSPDAMFARLIRRERTRAKTDRTGFVRGGIDDLQGIFERSINLRLSVLITMVQPGLSAAAVSINQLELLASVDAYVADTAMSKLEVFCSA